jgi:hypothetical protein
MSKKETNVGIVHNFVEIVGGVHNNHLCTIQSKQNIHN